MFMQNMAGNQPPLQLINPHGHRMCPDDHQIIIMLRLQCQGHALGHDSVKEVNLYSDYPEVFFGIILL